jgi:hypothetical protein
MLERVACFMNAIKIHETHALAFVRNSLRNFHVPQSKITFPSVGMWKIILCAMKITNNFISSKSFKKYIQITMTT